MKRDTSYLQHFPLVDRFYTWCRGHPWARHITITRHIVRCPLHECDVTLTVRTAQRGQHKAKHVDVLTCSLLPQDAVRSTGAANWSPNSTPNEVLPLLSNRTLIAPKGPCRHLDCLDMLNDSDDTNGQ